MVGFGHEKHTTHKVSGGDALSALTFPVTACSLHLFICVLAVYRQRDVIWETNITS